MDCNRLTGDCNVPIRYQHVGFISAHNILWTLAIFAPEMHQYVGRISDTDDRLLMDYNQMMIIFQKKIEFHNLNYNTDRNPDYAYLTAQIVCKIPASETGSLTGRQIIA